VKKAVLMGILNVTPDSFSDGGEYYKKENALRHAFQMVKEGVDCIDVGGESTRPGAFSVSEEDEMKRVIPVVKELSSQTNCSISIDTTKAHVALKALEYGAEFVNDVTGFSDPLMCEIVAEKKCKICVMHMLGTPRTMQDNPYYKKGVVVDVIDWFEKRLEHLLKKGVSLDRIYIDPGIGFGKSSEDNLILIKNLHLFRKLGTKIMIGLSRKSFIRKTLKKKECDLLSTTVAMNTLALVAQVDMIRVHDVQAHRDVIDLVTACLK
jgi:dihydropteroate synthase